MTRFFGSRFYSGFLLLLFFLMVAAASFNGFYTKWRLNDGHPSLGLSYMVEGTAARPYVYRQLLPAMANQIQSLLPVATLARISSSLSDPRKINSRSSLAMKYPESEALKPAVALRYYIVYYLTFFALVASLYVMRGLCLRVGATEPAAIAAPAIMALLLPFMLTEGGYFYDFTEVLFIMSAVTLALGVETLRSWRALLLLVLAGLATWNKEAFFWFTPALYPLLRAHLDRIRAAGLVSALMLAGGCVYLAMRLRYAGNPGSTVDFQLWGNLLFYADPGNWFRTENTYGILLPRGFSLVFVLVFAGLGVKAWRRLPVTLRVHGATAAAINLPLFLLFCSPGEMRNLSMLYPTLTLLIACALSAWLSMAARSGPAGRGTKAVD
ncbi:hypothetical protein IPU70_29915 [Achromobacter sp. SD115]|nr:hypothetical protein [Achromobacter sp. SD115]